MYLKNSLILINEFFYYTKNQIRNLYLKSRFYNNKISKIDSTSFYLLMKNIQISPSILSADFSQLGEEIKRL